MTRKCSHGLKRLNPDVLRLIIVSKLCWSRIISNVHLIHDSRSSVHAASWSLMFLVLYGMFVDMCVVMKSCLESCCFYVFSNWQVNGEEELRITWQNESLGSVACYSVGCVVLFFVVVVIVVELKTLKLNICERNTTKRGICIQSVPLIDKLCIRKRKKARAI